VIQVGDRVRTYSGEEATVYNIGCSLCHRRLPHGECGLFAQIGDRRWVNVDWLEKL
jgi:hypothetical protein